MSLRPVTASCDWETAACPLQRLIENCSLPEQLPGNSGSPMIANKNIVDRLAMQVFKSVSCRGASAHCSSGSSLAGSQFDTLVRHPPCLAVQYNCQRASVLCGVAVTEQNVTQSSSAWTHRSVWAILLFDIAMITWKIYTLERWISTCVFHWS